MEKLSSPPIFSTRVRFAIGNKVIKNKKPPFLAEVSVLFSANYKDSVRIGEIIVMILVECE